MMEIKKAKTTDERAAGDVVRLLANSYTLKEAVAASQTSERKFRKRLTLSRLGRENPDLYLDYLVLVGRPCDLCGRAHTPMEGTRQKEIYMGAIIVLFFCSKQHKEQWYQQDEAWGMPIPQGREGKLW